MATYRKQLLWLIGIATVIRFSICCATELANVEAYYWSWSVVPQLNYVDHPPLVAWMIWCTTLGQHFVTEFTVRLGPVIAAAVCTWFSFLIGSRLHSKQAGWFSAILYSTCLYTSVLAGGYVLPDGILLVFWLPSILVLLKIAAMSTGAREANRYWLWFGVLAGLCMMSKAHGVFIWLGAILYCLLYDRAQFKNPYLYLSVLISAMIVSPVISWNIQHDWFTWKFQSTRFNPFRGTLDYTRLIRHWISIVFLIGPVHFFLVWRGVLAVLRGRTPISAKASAVLLCCALPLLFTLFFVSFFREVYLHWAAPGYAGLLMLAAIEVMPKTNAARHRAKLPFILATCYCLLIAVLQPVIVNYFPGTFSTYKEGIEAGKDDPTTDMYGWKETASQYTTFYQNALREKKIKLGTPLIVTSWIPAAAIEFYIARRNNQQVFGVTGLDSLHEYFLMNERKHRLQAGEDALYIIPSNHMDSVVVEQVSAHFDSANNILTIPTYRANLLCKQTFFLLLKNYDGKAVTLK